MLVLKTINRVPHVALSIAQHRGRKDIKLHFWLHKMHLDLFDPNLQTNKSYTIKKKLGAELKMDVMAG